MADFKWFMQWYKDNPKDIFGPAFLASALGGAVVVATLLVTWGLSLADGEHPDRPARTRAWRSSSSSASGPRSIPGAAAFYTDPPIPPAPGDTLARDVYENVQVLGDLTQDNFDRLMLAMTRMGRARAELRLLPWRGRRLRRRRRSTPRSSRGA